MNKEIKRNNINLNIIKQKDKKNKIKYKDYILILKHILMKKQIN